MTIPQGKERGYARVEFIAKLPEIRAALKQGQSVRMVYGALRGGEISMSYSQFCRYVSGEISGAEGALPRRPGKKRNCGGDGPEPPAVPPSGEGLVALEGAPASMASVASTDEQGSGMKKLLSVAENFRPREVRAVRRSGETR